ncbi:Gammatubulin complex component 6like [Caligus rogercresseyi]|uniref:Gammatubulin complex component 6like n=1 Tax=Caligus rogercresseyi TaxID=217165 RepID=A0A7T8JX13_CALRO|nr:Gammatubulin complex component 6like [Caligus rogercresseyi]
MDDLEHKVKSLDELYEAHEKYLNKALFRFVLTYITTLLADVIPETPNMSIEKFDQ